MHRSKEATEHEGKFDDLDDAEISKMVEADFKAMMEEAMEEARAHLSDDPDELAYVEANSAQLMKGLALQKAAQEAFEADDLRSASELDRQKENELSEVLARAGKHGGLLARVSSWFLRRNLKR